MGGLGDLWRVGFPPGAAEIRPGWATTLVQVNVRKGRSKRSELLGALAPTGGFQGGSKGPGWEDVMLKLGCWDVFQDALVISCYFCGSSLKRRVGCQSFQVPKSFRNVQVKHFKPSLCSLNAMFPHLEEACR